MAIKTERFGTGYRDWLASIHGINNAKTLHCTFAGTVTADTLIPSGSLVAVSQDGSAKVYGEKDTYTPVGGDVLGLTVSDRVPDELNGKLVLNAATLFHGTVRVGKLPLPSQKALKTPGVASHNFVVLYQG